jgi:hypothetical protein
MQMLLTRGGLLDLLQHDPLAHLAALLAAVIHDYKHRFVGCGLNPAPGLAIPLPPLLAKCGPHRGYELPRRPS